MSETWPIPLEGEAESGPVGDGRLRQIVAYGRKVLDLGVWLGRVEDTRRKPLTPARLVAAAVFYTGLLRIRSFNALEPRLSEKPFLRLVGVAPQSERLCSVDTVGRSLCRMDLDSVRAISIAMIAKAERNKVFREGWHGALRYVAIDGWEPFCSRHRHCSECLERRVRVKAKDDSTVVEDSTCCWTSSRNCPRICVLRPRRARASRPRGWSRLPWTRESRPRPRG
jgi:hypothetical protein